MPEYTISTADGNDWPTLGTNLAAVLKPRSFECEILENTDVLTFRSGATTVSASWELLGTWYVDIEDAPSPETADRLVDEMARQLGEATGQQAIHYRVTD
ncbi:hypothetical protein BN159_0181 [Streptomyces davaonensis JCM 4913]|uniref:Uncharacterized protein n=1 Tax=Streptomyces davaonensis (strain DSM 101723 / JCM 4913 / KCC S-0913 / 768) TaxID=1214101 RepID=K4QUU7_STRDJ|nr:hypothetical protein [Streptomyces davaonensis]CCK24560.1 hypothetical protein BN159_0181 [Streptomyces davaonensis JCM 4913]